MEAMVDTNETIMRTSFLAIGLFLFFFFMSGWFHSKPHVVSKSHNKKKEPSDIIETQSLHAIVAEQSFSKVSKITAAGFHEVEPLNDGVCSLFGLSPSPLRHNLLLLLLADG